MIKVYISGKISGLDPAEAYNLFEKAEITLYERGFTPINPMKLEHNHDKSWESYMKQDIKALCDCDAIHLLTNWKGSQGAKLEFLIACYLKLQIID